MPNSLQKSLAFGFELGYGMHMTTTGYEITEAPEFAGMRVWDCVRCGHEELGRPVFLTGGGLAVGAYGTGCAAKLLGIVEADLIRDRAAADLAACPAAQQVFVFVKLCRPGRITAKFVGECEARVSFDKAATVAVAVAAWKAGVR